MKSLCAFVFLILTTFAASAQERRPLNLRDVVNDSKGWEAVGRLQIGKNGVCSAALIEPTLVLTAAHCLFDKETQARIPDSELKFRAGYRIKRGLAYRNVVESIAHPDYDPARKSSPSQVAADLALVRLDRPYRDMVLAPVPVSMGGAIGEEVRVVSYYLNRDEVPSLHEFCFILGSMGDAQVLTCHVDFGSSGAPIFSMVDDEPVVISVVSAMAEMGGKRVALAAPLGEGFQLIRGMLTP